MSDFKAGDRVKWHFAEHGERHGRITSVDGDRAYVTEDGYGDSVGAVPRGFLTRVEEMAREGDPHPDFEVHVSYVTDDADEDSVRRGRL